MTSIQPSLSYYRSSFTLLNPLLPPTPPLQISQQLITIIIILRQRHKTPMLLIPRIARHPFDRKTHLDADSYTALKTPRESYSVLVRVAAGAADCAVEGDGWVETPDRGAGGFGVGGKAAGDARGIGTSAEVGIGICMEDNSCFRGHRRDVMVVDLRLEVQTESASRPSMEDRSNKLLELFYLSPARINTEILRFGCNIDHPQRVSTSNSSTGGADGRRPERRNRSNPIGGIESVTPRRVPLFADESESVPDAYTEPAAGGGSTANAAGPLKEFIPQLEDLIRILKELDESKPEDMAKAVNLTTALLKETFDTVDKMVESCLLKYETPARGVVAEKQLMQQVEEQTKDQEKMIWPTAKDAKSRRKAFKQFQHEELEPKIEDYLLSAFYAVGFEPYKEWDDEYRFAASAIAEAARGKPRRKWNEGIFASMRRNFKMPWLSKE
ncbi:hypothetical protein BJ508DRAFT_339057 [Ascobolus immersus RN42]|uniref:Uncharacterized protein n=1 Tax=Ascobolus immersus RN42 TaxID=1160509 RepID=A0A3N4HNA7_ASCIM|nr:hypothetical protein BJ508DRAFT_339057 [Ascobolus immersus RN42]